MVVIHCNDRFWEDIHAEVVGSGGSNVGRCNRAVGNMVHIELHRDCVGDIDVKFARICAILDRRFDHLEGSCNRSNHFCGLYWHLDITNESGRLILVFRLDHDVRERARLGVAEGIHDIVCSSDIDVGNYVDQQKDSMLYIFAKAH